MLNPQYTDIIDKPSVSSGVGPYAYFTTKDWRVSCRTEVVAFALANAGTARKG